MNCGTTYSCRGIGCVHLSIQRFRKIVGKGGTKTSPGRADWDSHSIYFILSPRMSMHLHLLNGSRSRSACMEEEIVTDVCPAPTGFVIRLSLHGPYWYE